jgi:hypothetical protein
MNYKNQMLLVLLMAALFSWTACSEGGSDSEEPNNTIEEAKEMDLDKAQIFTIQPKGDHDWFKVKVPEEGYLKVAASNVPDNLDLVFRIALHQEWEGKTAKFISKHRSVPGAVMLNEGGEYYVLVHQNYDDNTSEQEMQLKITHLPQFDKTEPNNSPENVAEAKLGESFPIAIFPLEDVDFYKFTTEEEGYIRLMTKDVPTAITPVFQVSLYDEWSEPKLKELKGWTEFPGAFYAKEPGDYYIKITDDYNDASSEQMFDIRSEFLAQNDTLEPNEKLVDASEAKRGDTLRMAIFPMGDTDLYKISSGDGTAFKISAKNVKGIKLVAQLHVRNPDDNNKLKSVGSWEEIPHEFDVEPDKEYFIKFADDYNDAASYELFEVRIE